MTSETAANTNLLLFRNARIAATIVGVIAAVSLVMGTLFVLLGRIQS